MENPWYQDVTSPLTGSEINEARVSLNNQVDQIIKGVSSSDSGIVHRMASEVRGTEQFKNDGGDCVEMGTGITLEPIMLSRLHVAEEVESKAINAIKEQIEGNGVNINKCSENENSSRDESDDEKKFIADDLNSIDENENKKELEKESDKSSKLKLDSKPNGGNVKHKIHIHNKPINDYTENPELLSKCFPTLFPLGLT